MASAHRFLSSPAPLSIQRIIFMTVRIFLSTVPFNSGVQSAMSYKTAPWERMYILNAELISARIIVDWYQKVKCFPMEFISIRPLRFMWTFSHTDPAFLAVGRNGRRSNFPRQWIAYARGTVQYCSWHLQHISDFEVPPVRVTHL